MADALNLGVGLPLPIGAHGQTTTYTTFNLDNQNDGVAMVVHCPDAATITHVGFRQGTSGGTGAAASSWTVSLQSLGTTGLPSGTPLGSTSTTYSPSTGNDGLWVWVALSSSYSAARDEEFAIVIQRNTSIADDTTNFGQVGYANNWITVRAGNPYALTKAAAGAWTKAGTVGPMLGYKSSSKAYGYPATAIFLAESAGATTEKGMYFTVPSNWWSTYKLKGVRAYMAGPVTSGANTGTCNLYGDLTGTNPTILASSNASDQDNVAGSGQRVREWYFTGTAPTLNAGTEYGIGFSCGTASDIGLAVIDMATNTDRTAYSMGEQMGMISRTLASAYPPDASDGAFTRTDTKRPWVELILEDITAPSGGGGGGLLTHPGMGGGMRG